MEPRNDEKRDPKAPEVSTEQPRLKRFRIVKLEERIAPLSGGGGTSDYCGYATKSGYKC